MSAETSQRNLQAINCQVGMFKIYIPENYMCFVPNWQQYLGIICI
jgi:hypothetical protein